MRKDIYEEPLPLHPIRQNIERTFLIYFLTIFVLFFTSLCIRIQRLPNDYGSAFTQHYQFFISRIPRFQVHIYNITVIQHTELTNSFYLFPIVHNIAHTAVFELILHKTLLASPFCSNSSKSDFFFVPLYGALYNGRAALADIYNVVVPQLNRWDSHFGLDHCFTQIFIAHGNMPITPEIQSTIPSMVAVGDIVWDHSIQSPFLAWRLTVFPYTSNLPQLKAQTDRIFSAFFIGQLDLNDFDPRAAEIRTSMARAMKHIPKSLVIVVARNDPKKSVYSYDYGSLMTQSEFCVVPHGDGPASKRLYDSMRTLCLPIVLTDEIRFPFEGLFVDYSQIIIQVPADRPDLIQLAMNALGNDQKLLMRKKLIEISAILEQRFDFLIQNGDLTWAWIWTHFIKKAVCSASIRRFPQPIHVQ